jgi:serine/threonine protein phosphatase PrpC
MEPLVSDGPATPATVGATVTCPSCGADADAEASFCEACGADLTGGATEAAATEAAASEEPELAAATPQTAPAGAESPLDVGWTGPVVGAAGSGADAVRSSGQRGAAGKVAATAAEAADQDVCRICGQGKIVDGYCDNCGSPPPDPRDHFTERPAAWVGGACDIGRRHTRNEDAMALHAGSAPGSRAVLVVCDGVSNTTDSHIASLAAARAARAVLRQPFARGAGTQDSWAAAAGRSLESAVLAANQAVCDVAPEGVANPPSCTFAAAVVEDSFAAIATVGDSRIYWLPDDPAQPAVQLGRDDSFAAEELARGVSRADAESGPNAHSITRWLGRDAPDDVTPHLTTQDVSLPGWLLVCSDGLWNYCSEAEALRDLLEGMVRQLSPADPVGVAEALLAFANEQGGQDNITVALARLAGQGSNPEQTHARKGLPEKEDQADG